jgi:hypothetical protein
MTMNELIQEIWRTWTNGGWVMAAMALLAVIMYSSAVRLLMALYYRGLTKASDLVMRGWVSRPGEAPSRIRELIRYTQDELHSVIRVIDEAKLGGAKDVSLATQKG